MVDEPKAFSAYLAPWQIAPLERWKDARPAMSMDQPIAMMLEMATANLAHLQEADDGKQGDATYQTIEASNNSYYRRLCIHYCYPCEH